jgi:cell shape-determining protein MreC
MHSEIELLAERAYMEDRKAVCSDLMVDMNMDIAVAAEVVVAAVAAVVDMENVTMRYIANYISNSLSNECNDKIFEQKRKEELKEMQEREKKQRELAKMRLRSKVDYDSDITSLETFARGDYATCPVCYRRCNNISCGCSNPTMFSVVGAMNGASKVLKENKELKQKVEALKKENEELLVKLQPQPQ